jgi:hypothetical protein
MFDLLKIKEGVIFTDELRFLMCDLGMYNLTVIIMGGGETWGGFHITIYARLIT